MKAEQLHDEFAGRALSGSGDVLRLRAADALALVDRAAEEGVPILGIEAFGVAGGAPASPSGHASGDAADFSAAVARGHGCWQGAEAFIRARGDRGVAFALALGDDPVEVV